MAILTIINKLYFLVKYGLSGGTNGIAKDCLNHYEIKLRKLPIKFANTIGFRYNFVINKLKILKNSILLFL